MLHQFLLYCNIAKRSVAMFPRRKKSIRLLHLDHQTVEGNTNLLHVKYRFSNAIYYSIGGKKTLNQHIIINRPAPGTDVPFTVQGFLKQNDYMLSFEGNEVILTRVVQKFRFAEVSRNVQPQFSI